MDAICTKENTGPVISEKLCTVFSVQSKRKQRDSEERDQEKTQRDRKKSMTVCNEYEYDKRSISKRAAPKVTNEPSVVLVTELKGEMTSKVTTPSVSRSVIT